MNRVTGGAVVDQRTPPKHHQLAQTAVLSLQGGEVEPRAGGTVRVTFERHASGECLVCGATFSGTGQAASHCRATRHQVQCSYSSRFAFVPVETLDGGAK